MSDQSRPKSRRSNNKFKYGVISFLALTAVITMWVFGWAITDWIWGNELVGGHATSLPDRGLIGDSFGAINALFSGLAFAGVIIAILMQSEELELQRDELKDTRDVIDQQRFENTFFQMLQQWTSLIDLIDIHVDAGQRVRGKRALAQIRGELQSWGNEAPTAKLDNVRALYERLYEEHGDHLGHYFRLLYHIIKLVNNSRLEEKSRYTGIVRAHLSSSEIALLLYNGLSVHGTKFKPLIEQYALLKNVDNKYLILPVHRTFYDASAFGRPAQVTSK